MAETQRLNITVPTEMHEEWKQAVEEDQVAQSISELVRTSVNRNLDGHLSGSQPADAVSSQEVSVDLEPIEDELEGISAQLDRIESEARTSDSTEENEVDLQKIVFRMLNEVAVPPHLSKEDIEGYWEDGEILSHKEIAERIDAEPNKVLTALLNLEPREPSVASKQLDETSLWWREP